MPPATRDAPIRGDHWHWHPPMAMALPGLGRPDGERVECLFGSAAPVRIGALTPPDSGPQSSAAAMRLHRTSPSPSSRPRPAGPTYSLMRRSASHSARP